MVPIPDTDSKIFCLKPFFKEALIFTCQRDKSLKNTVGKGEIAHYEQFLPFPQCFGEFSTIFIKLKIV